MFLPTGPFLTLFYPMFANYVHTKTMFVHVSESEVFFSRICSSKFAVECDWSSKNPQNFENLSFLEKIAGFFEKNLEIFQNHYMWQTLQIASRIVFFLENENDFPSKFSIRRKIKKTDSVAVYPRNLRA